MAYTIGTPTWEVFVNSRTLFAPAVLCLLSGCQPKNQIHDCACLCYKEIGTTVYSLTTTVSTTGECGNVNGGVCSFDASDGKHIDGQYANCGPNPNVAAPRVPRPQGNPPKEEK